MKRGELEERAERALHFLRDSAEQHAKLRATSDYMDAWVKTVLAKCKQKAPGLSQAAAEASAMGDPEYLAALEARKRAAEEWYHALFLRDAAFAHIDAWRTCSSNERATV